jgi:predicted O-methyltransferase YrrM
LANERFDFFLENEKTLPDSIDLLFLDGHHQSTALLRYYAVLKKRFSQKTIVVVDDIYWSKDMQDGWKKLMDMPEVTQSVDCFQFGLLFFRNEFLEKEHHCIRLPLKALFRT